jgi:NADPH-dependent curcumin reductase CurA
MGLLGWQTHVTGSPEAMMILSPLSATISDPYALSVLGITTGMAAYFGLLEVTKPVAGETVVVSAAAGGVGSLAGQIAKLQGCRVVAIAGGPAKCKYVTEELGFDAAIDHRVEDVGRALDHHCPGGIDIDFENVGGPILDQILLRMNQHGRISVCGMVSGYNQVEAPGAGPHHFVQIVMKRLRVEGFVATDYLPRFGEAVATLDGWVAAGKLRQRYYELDGFARLPDALREVVGGRSDHIGKMVVKLAGA